MALSSRLGRHLAWSGAITSLVAAGVALAVAESTPSTAFVAIGTGLLVTLVLLGSTERQVLAPLARLKASIENARKGDFFVRVRVEGNDEVSDLAASLNSVMARITDLRAESIDAEREMDLVKTELVLKEKIAEQSDAIESANRRLNQRLSRLSFLYNLGHELASQLHVDSLLERFSTLVHEELMVAEFAVLLFDESRGHARVEVWKGKEHSKTYPEAALDTEGTVSGQALAERRSIYVPDLATDERRVVVGALDGRTGSVLVVPVVYQRRLLGLLHFRSPEKDAFSEEDRNLFEAVANQAALALANAQLFDKAVELSLTDPLTGIPNRRSLQQRLEQEWAAARRYDRPLSLVMLDVDYFKNYNDQHGHLQGDEVLRRISQILVANVRRSDAIGRFGGEEFLVLLPEANKEQALGVAQKLRRSVEQADFPGGYLQPLGRITISCGVATAREDAETLGELVEAADEAMLVAKKAGKNQVQDAALERS